MGRDTRRRLAWCILFALVVGGPYLLGVHGQAAAAAASGAYGFAATGLLAGMWFTCYPGVAAFMRRRAVWRACLCVGLAVQVAVLAFGLFEFAFSAAAEVPLLHVALFGDDGLARAWALEALEVAEAVGSCEKPLTFVTASLCGAISAWLAGMGCAERVTAHRGAVAGLAVLGMFLVGFLRVTAWDLFLPSAFGAVLLLGVLFEWAWCMARRSGLRASMGAFCMGELAFRLTSRFGMQVMPVSDGLSCAAAVVCAVCLCVCIAAFSPWPGKANEIDSTAPRDSTPAAEASAAEPAGGAGLVDGPALAPALEAWERGRLEEAGLTGRELDVLVASLAEADSAAVARRLGLQASTVRTYKGRICKKLGFESFDKLVSARAAGAGLFAPPEPERTAGQGRPASAPPTGRAAVSATLRFVGCASSLVLLLMPYGTLPAFWDATWVMALAVACGVMVAFCAGALRRYVGARRDEARRAWISSLPFAGCVALTAYLRLGMELGGWGFPESMQVALFLAVTGLVCFGTFELRCCLDALCFNVGALAAGSAVVAAVAALAALPTSLRYGLTVATPLVSVAGLALGTGRIRVVRQDEPLEVSVHPLVALSWLVAAFLWEECWRGVRYVSLQDVGLPFLAVLVAADTIVLVRRGNRMRAAYPATWACSACICVAQGLAFGLLVVFALLDA